MIREGDTVITPTDAYVDEWTAQLADNLGYFEVVGQRQAGLLIKARRAKEIVLLNGENAERCAARRLVARGLLERYRFGSAATGWLTIYKLTARGRDCWLKLV